MRRLLRQNRGAALVEFAFVSLLLFTLLMGIIECGIIITDYMCLNTGVRETVRQIALRTPGDEPDPVIDVHAEVCKSAPTLDAANVFDAKQSYRVGTDGGFVDGPPPADLDASSTIQVKVEAKYTCERLSSLIFDEPVVLSTDIIMKRE